MILCTSYHVELEVILFMYLYFYQLIVMFVGVTDGEAFYHLIVMFVSVTDGEAFYHLIVMFVNVTDGEASGSQSQSQGLLDFGDSDDEEDNKAKKGSDVGTSDDDDVPLTSLAKSKGVESAGNILSLLFWGCSFFMANCLCTGGKVWVWGCLTSLFPLLCLRLSRFVYFSLFTVSVPCLF